jgi:multicomponent K+:H+ antiporter subunit D
MGAEAVAAAFPPLLIAPVLLPLVAGAVLLLAERYRARWVPALSLAAAVALLGVALLLFAQAADGAVRAYLVGNWRAPFGIALALDRLSALMLLLTALLALAALVYARGGDEQRSPHFHPLVQFQLMGLNGAFLTADLFNLFVFFEVLLIASYGLLLHGGGAARLRAALHYVTINLVASALFLIAVALLYGVTGTLNLADLALRVPALGPEHAQLVRAAGLLLLVVFCVKAAALPLYFWLPDSYGAASAPAAALFAIMTKVGIYAILRVTTLVFGAEGGGAAALAAPWLAAVGLATLAAAAIGAAAAQRLRVLVSYLVVFSAGTLLLAVGLARAGTLAAGLVYLVNSTLATAALFLLVDRVQAARTPGDALQPAAFSAGRGLLGGAYFALAIAMAGLPPLAGFVAKAWLLVAAADHAAAVWVWVVLLGSSLIVIIALARAGALLFWQPGEAAPPSPAAPLRAVQIGPLLGLLAATVVCAIAAGPLAAYAQASARQLLERQQYIGAVLDAAPVPPALRPRERPGWSKPE